MTTVLITGATSGIGRAMAVALAGAGYEVYALGRNKAVLNELRASHRNIVPLAVDMTDREQLEAAVADIQVDVLINNAGIMPPLGNFADMAVADIDSTLEINLSAVIILTRLVVPQMRARETGHVLFTGSAAAHTAFPNIAVYSATKAAIAGFAASLRADLSPHGVRVPIAGVAPLNRAARPRDDRFGAPIALTGSRMIDAAAALASLLGTKGWMTGSDAEPFCRAKVTLADRNRSPVERALMGRLKAAFDPAGIMNPGVVVRAPLRK